MALLACSGEPPPPPAPAPIGASLARPCDLLTPELATQVAGKPYFRAMQVNLVDNGFVTCAHGMGAGGLQGVVRAIVHLPRVAGPAELRFAALCRGDAVSRLARQDRFLMVDDAEPQVAVAGPQVPVTQGRTCALPRGGQAVLLEDRVLEVGYEEANGSMNPELSRLFAIALLNAADAVPSRNAPGPND